MHHHYQEWFSPTVICLTKCTFLMSGTLPKSIYLMYPLHNLTHIIHCFTNSDKKPENALLYGLDQLYPLLDFGDLFFTKPGKMEKIY